MLFTMSEIEAATSESNDSTSASNNLDPKPKDRSYLEPIIKKPAEADDNCEDLAEDNNVPAVDTVFGEFDGPQVFHEKHPKDENIREHKGDHGENDHIQHEPGFASSKSAKYFRTLKDKLVSTKEAM